MSQRIASLKTFLLNNSHPIVQSITTKSLLFGGAAFGIYNIGHYALNRYRINQGFNQMKHEYDSCFEKTTISNVVNSGYEVHIHYNIEENDGDLIICVPEHGAWFSDFGINREDLKEIKELLTNGKVIFHRTSTSLFACIGDANLAPSLLLGDSPMDHNFAASTMNSPTSKRYDIILHATPSEEAEKEYIFKDMLRFMASHAGAVAMGILISRFAWNRTLSKHVDSFVQNLSGASSSKKGWNSYSFKVAFGAGFGGALVHAIYDAYPIFKTYQFSIGREGLFPSNSFQHALIYIIAKSFGTLIQMTFLYFIILRFYATRNILIFLRNHSLN